MLKNPSYFKILFQNHFLAKLHKASKRVRKSSCYFPTIYNVYCVSFLKHDNVLYYESKFSRILILAFWYAYALLEDRRTDDVNLTNIFSLSFQMAESA